MTLEFIQSMVQWFKDGKTLPKRYVWEIVLGAYEAFASEPSLVEVPVPEGTTIDVIGDVHGRFLQPVSDWIISYAGAQDNSTTCYICVR